MSAARHGSVASWLVALAVMLGSPAAQAQSAALSGLMGTKALLVVDGGEPKLVAPGESYKGVKVVSIQGDSAILDIAGRRQTLRVGDAPVSVGTPQAPGAGTRIVLPASSGGHFITQGQINSRPVQFMVDTGATVIGISIPEAERLGLNYRQGQMVQVSTANGMAQGWRIQLASVRLNDVEVRNVEAIVTPGEMPFILLGNSYLTRFQMTRSNQQMVLEKRY